MNQLVHATMELWNKPFDHNNTFVEVVYQHGQKAEYGDSFDDLTTRITLRVRQAYTESYRYDKSTFAWIVDAGRTGGLVLTASLPHVDALMSKDFQRRLGPGWTENQLRKALTTLLSKAIARLQLNNRVQNLYARFKEQDISNIECFTTTIDHIEKVFEHTSIYADMTDEDIDFWDNWLTNIRFTYYEKDGKKVRVIRDFDDSTLNPDPSHTHQYMLENGWNPTGCDPIPGIQMKTPSGNYSWDL
jgi:hypothetical protein